MEQLLSVWRKMLVASVFAESYTLGALLDGPMSDVCGLFMIATRTFDRCFLSILSWLARRRAAAFGSIVSNHICPRDRLLLQYAYLL
jgi:hypothetical protein